MYIFGCWLEKSLIVVSAQQFSYIYDDLKITNNKTIYRRS